MRIAVISSTVFAVGTDGAGYAPLAGYAGLEPIAWYSAKGLAAKGHEVCLIAPQGSSCPDASVITTGPPGTWDERRAFESYKNELPKMDAIIDHSWCKNSFLLKMAGQLKAPVLAVCHAPINTMYQSLPPVEKPCFVCISNDQAIHFKALFTADCRVAYNGVDTEHYKLSEVPRSNRFLFLGRFSSIKGPLLAIEACKAAGVGLDLIGDTSITQEPEYYNQCKSLCDGKQIRMVGPASRGNCVWWFNQAHCMIHANKLFREPFGLAPVEAQLCGCPVIGYDNGALRETVKTSLGPTGILVKTQNELVMAIRTMANGTDNDCRLRCRSWALQFSVEAMVNRYEQLCVEAIESGGW